VNPQKRSLLASFVIAAVACGLPWIFRVVGLDFDSGTHYSLWLAFAWAFFAHSLHNPPQKARVVVAHGGSPCSVLALFILHDRFEMRS
jgi:hypothetical protein